jgi:hypothetical protein
MKAWKDKSIDNLSDRLDRLEANNNNNNNNAATNQDPDELEKLTPMERYILKFNWYARQIMPYYKAVMFVHNLTSEEYDSCVLEGDQSIYLPQPNRKFEPTSYKERVAYVLGLDYQRLQDKIARGETKEKIAIGLIDAAAAAAAAAAAGGTGSAWSDEDPNRVF